MSDRHLSTARGLGEVDPEPVAPTLIAPRHLGGGVAELLLDEALVDLGRGGEASAQRMAGEGLATLSFRQITSHPGGERHSLD